MITQTKPMTAEELAAWSGRAGRSELVKGEYIEMAPASGGHGAVGINIGYWLVDHVRRHPTGRVYAAETGFVLARNPDTVRAPDASYLAFPRGDHPLDQPGFIEGPPDLAVEVVSPNDTEREVAAKVADFMGAGTPLVWVIRAKNRTVTVHDASGDVRVLGEGEVLDGGDVLPGFGVEVGQLFA
ncbi:MAG: Uma2 family endonuclease [Ardenticatenales bacterium]|nr:Uma2 family endonuclease [Ardenticatenales bacterium]